MPTSSLEQENGTLVTRQQVSTAADNHDDAEGVRAMIDRYTDSRVENEKVFFHRVVKIGSIFFVIGFVFQCIGTTLFTLTGGYLTITGFSVQVFGTVCMLTGVLALTLCPYEAGKDGCIIALSFDHSMKEHPWI